LTAVRSGSLLSVLPVLQDPPDGLTQHRTLALFAVLQRAQPQPDPLL